MRYTHLRAENLVERLGYLLPAPHWHYKVLSRHLLRTSGAEVNLHLHNSTPCTDSTVDSQDDTTGVVRPRAG